jgi:hypothetical protein
VCAASSARGRGRIPATAAPNDPALEPLDTAKSGPRAIPEAATRGRASGGWRDPGDDPWAKARNEMLSNHRQERNSVATHFIECTYSHLHVKDRIVYVNTCRIVYAFEQDGKFMIKFRDPDDQAIVGEVSEISFRSLTGKS